MHDLPDFDEEGLPTMNAKRAENKINIRETLADLVLERALPKNVLTALCKGTAEHMILLVPSADWQTPIGEALNELRQTIHPVFPGTAKTANDDRRVIRQYVEADHTLVGVAVTVGSLPGFLRTVAPSTYAIPPLDAKLMATLLRRACKGPVPRSAATLNYGLLEFDEICALVKVDADCSDVVERLSKAIEAKTRMARPGEQLPDIEQASEFGDARQFAIDLKIDLADIRSGRIGWKDADSGIVLHGPPGTGKTTYARALGEYLGVPVVIGSMSEFFASSSGYLDNIIKAQRALFEKARSSAPCILFLDEVDSTPNIDNTDSRHRDYWAPIVADFLTLLDGAVNDREGVIVVGATNRLHAISPALRRPGRFERAVYIGPPGPDGAERIFRHHLGNDLRDQDLSHLAVQAAGRQLTGADIMDVTRAARRKARRAKRDMTLGDLQSAIFPGPELPAELRRRVAAHEAGHSLIGALHFPDELVAVSIDPRGSDTGGHTKFSKSVGVYTSAELAHRVELLLAGRQAEILLCGSPSTGCGGDEHSDLGMAVQTLAASYLCWGTSGQPRWRCPPTEAVAYLAADRRARVHVEKALAAAAVRVSEKLTLHRSALEAVTERLLNERTLAGNVVLDLVKTNPPRKPKSTISEGDNIIPIDKGTNRVFTNA